MDDITIKSALPSSVKKTASDAEKKLRRACEEFESVFTYEMLKSMRKGIEKCDLFSGGQGEEIYESMLDQELSKNMAGKGSNSLSEMLYQQLKGIAGIPDDSGEGTKDTSLPVWPVKNARVSSSYGWRKDPFSGNDKFHHGVDLAAGRGTEVKAAMSGKVQITDNQNGYGKVVVLDHGQGFSTLYAHNDDILVKAGDWVTKGTAIAKVGSTGRSTGPHLHFEVRRDGKQLDPEEFLKS